MSEKKEPTHIPVTQWGNTGDEKHDAALLKLKEISDRVSTLSDKVLYTFDVAGAFKRVDGNSSLVNIGELAELMAPIVEYYEANQDIIDRLEDWPALTGLTRDELDQMELQEVVALIRERNEDISATDTLELVVVDAIITPTKQGGAISQAQATRSAVDIYMKLPQGKHTNQIAHSLATNITKGLNAKTVQVDLYGKATITGYKFKLHIEGYDKLLSGIGASASKLLDVIHKTCWDNQDTLARIPLRDYMELRGMVDIKTAREQVKNDLKVLKGASIEYEGKVNGSWYFLSLCGGYAEIRNSVIYFRLTPEYYASIPENQFAYIPTSLYATDDKNHPNSFYFGRAICVNKRMNLGKRNENIIGIKTLLEASPALPKKEDVGKKWRERIQERFERDMDYIGELTYQGIMWEYQNPATPTQSYEQFIEGNVVIKWTNYPDEEVKQLRANKIKANKHRQGRRKKTLN